jgi:hypothetical protein
VVVCEHLGHGLVARGVSFRRQEDPLLLGRAGIATSTTWAGGPPAPRGRAGLASPLEPRCGAVGRPRPATAGSRGRGAAAAGRGRRPPRRHASDPPCAAPGNALSLKGKSSAENTNTVENSMSALSSIQSGAHWQSTRGRGEERGYSIRGRGARPALGPLGPRWCHHGGRGSGVAGAVGGEARVGRAA